MTALLESMFEGLGTSLAELGARRLVRSRPATRKVRTTVFAAGPDPHIPAFYEYFAARIGAARNCVYMTGKGFESSLKCEGLAAGLVTSIGQALRRGVPVIRLQTHPVVSDFWHDQLKALVAEFPQLFELHVLLDATQTQPLNLCAIDIDDPARNITEMMIETPRYLGTRRCQVATYAVFHKGHQMLAQAIRDQIIELTQNPAISRRLETAGAVTGFFRGEYYFAYGSNMDPAQMLTRCPSAMRICTAVLQDHKLVFNRTGTYRPGGVANVEPAPGEKVYGIIWKLPSNEFHSLDQTEDPSAYRRYSTQVYSLSGQAYDCHLYVAIPDQLDIPDRHYLDTLIRAAQHAGLPPEYLAHLKSRRTQPLPIATASPSPPGCTRARRRRDPNPSGSAYGALPKRSHHPPFVGPWDKSAFRGEIMARWHTGQSRHNRTRMRRRIHTHMEAASTSGLGVVISAASGCACSSCYSQ